MSSPSEMSIALCVMLMKSKNLMLLNVSARPEQEFSA